MNNVHELLRVRISNNKLTINLNNSYISMSTIRPNKLYDLIIKILIVGDATVGKSTLLTRMIDKEWIPNLFGTVGIDFRIKMCTINDKKIKIQIWDTAGQERFRDITQAYFRGMHGVMIVYDVTNYESYTNIHNWISRLDEHSDGNLIKCLVGTKNDLLSNKRVSDDEARDLSSKYNIPFYITSAKIGDGVDDALNSFIKTVIESKDEYKEEYKDEYKEECKGADSENSENSENSESCCKCSII